MEETMIFREYVELLYQAYLQDKGYLETLRQKIKSEEFNKDQMYDSAFQNWKKINPGDSLSYRQKVKYHPNEVDPQQGVYVYEHEQRTRDTADRVKRCLKKKNDQY